MLAASALALSAAGLLLAYIAIDNGAGEPAEPVIAQANKTALGLMTSLPIYWNEGDAFAALGDNEAKLPWVRSVLERRYVLAPLDLLANDNDESTLGTLDRLAIVQPRGLSPADNVALDDWVRGGGKLLYVIDPMLSGEYEAALGDPRHPVVSALVPPVFRRWGLELRFDEAQSEQPRLARWGEVTLPVVMAGEMALVAAADPAVRGDCELSEDGIAARCKIGEGSAVIIADAALFEPRESNAEAEAALLALFAKALS